MVKCVWGFFILIGMILGGCAHSQLKMRENLKRVEYNLEGVELLPTSDGLGTGLGLVLEFELTNSLKEAMIFDSLVTQVSLNGEQLAEVSHMNHVKIEPGTTQNVKLKLTSQWGLADWMQILRKSNAMVSLEFRGKAWSRVDYWLWDSVKETNFSVIKEVDVGMIKQQIALSIQNSIQEALGLPGAILDPTMRQIFQ